MIASLVDRMIAAGMSPGEAGSIAAELYAAGAASASVRSPGAERTRRYRAKQASQSDDKRHAVTLCDGDNEPSQTVTNRHKPSQCDASTVLYRENSNKKDSRQNSKRGTRVDPAWTPSEADRQLAKQEGFSDSEIDREAMRFRDFWTGKAGAGGVKLDWASTWRNWVRNSADRLGKAPVTNGAAPTAPENLDWDAILTTYKKIGHWSKWAGPDLTSPACRAPREMLEKYGLLADGRIIN